MSKAKRFTFQQGQDYVVPGPSRSRVARVQGLRGSSASGAHDSTPRRQRSRQAARTAAIRSSY